MIVGVRALSPTVHIKAFTASEIVHFAEGGGGAGGADPAGSPGGRTRRLPGGGAEIFAERVRTEVCPAKISGERWLEVHALAHRLGIRTNATMLYGHVESYEDRVDHFLRLRATQDQTGGFQAFIALAFQPAPDTPLAHLPGTTGIDDLKTMAVARLLLDNFDHIKTYWVMTGLKLAQTRPVLRRQRHGRHGGRGGHLLDVGGGSRAGAVEGRTRAGHPRRRPDAGGAGRAVSDGAPVRRRGAGGAGRPRHRPLRPEARARAPAAREPAR